jgi:hypothetical protein
LEVPVLHFSGELIYLGDGHWASPQALGIMPSDPEDQLSTLLGDVFREDRERALQGLEPDPERGDKLQHILQAFYDEIIQPSLNTMRTDCSAARSLVPRAFRWERSVELVVRDAEIAALENCFNTTKGDCLDTSDPVQMNEAGMFSRQLALFGVEDPAYNVANPDLQCRKGWSGTATRTRNLNGSALTDVISADVQWEIDPANTHPGVSTQYRIKRGTIRWEQKGTDQDGCTHEGGPQSFDLTGQDGVIIVDEVNHTYQATGIASHFATVTVTCPPQLPSGTSDVSVGDWLITPVTSLPEDATELSGTYQFPDPNTTYVWSFSRPPLAP